MTYAGYESFPTKQSAQTVPMNKTNPNNANKVKCFRNNPRLTADPSFYEEISSNSSFFIYEQKIFIFVCF